MNTPRTDADTACDCIDKLASECRLNPTAYQCEAKEKIRQLERELNEALKESERQTEIADAMTNYMPDAKREQELRAKLDAAVKALKRADGLIDEQYPATAQAVKDALALCEKGTK